MNVWVGTASRRSFLDLISDGPLGPIHLIDESGLVQLDPRPGEILLLWPSDPRADKVSPTAVIVPEGEETDFLAWAGTYLPDRTPVTSLLRVVTPPVLTVAGTRPLAPHLGAVLGAATGAVLAESIIEIAAQHANPSEISHRSFASTFSFAAARARGFAATFEGLELLHGRWREALDLCQSRRALRGPDLLDLWRCLFLTPQAAHSSPGGGKADSILGACCESLLVGQEISRHLWNSVCYGSPELTDAPSRMRGASREQRVKILQSGLRFLAGDGSRQPRGTFIAGYLASLIGGGELSHYRLLLDLAPPQWGSLLWYGVCAGFRNSAELTRFNEGLGWRVQRELLRWESLSSAPQGDVALEEFRILAKEPRRSAFRLDNPGTVRLEILPRIHVWLRRHDKGHAGMPLDSRGELPVGPRVVLDDVRGALGDLERAQRKLLGLLGPSVSTIRKPRRKPAG